MAQAKFEFFEDEMGAMMEILLKAEEVLDLKTPKAPTKNPSSGKYHLYLETREHKKRTNSRALD